MTHIRRAEAADASRIAEIEIFNYRLQFYPIFRSDEFYFEELQVVPAAEKLLASPEILADTWVYDDGVVKGFIRLAGTEVKKLFVEPVLQGHGIGAALLEFAVGQGANSCGRWRKTPGPSRFISGTGLSSPAKNDRKRIRKNFW